jgi:hypothetical protein
MSTIKKKLELPLTDGELQVFETIRNVEYENIALMRGSFRGRTAAFIISIEHNGDGGFDLRLLAVLLRPEDMGDCLSAEGDPAEVLKP